MSRILGGPKRPPSFSNLANGETMKKRTQIEPRGEDRLTPLQHIQFVAVVQSFHKGRITSDDLFDYLVAVGIPAEEADTMVSLITGQGKEW